MKSVFFIKEATGIRWDGTCFDNLLRLLPLGSYEVTVKKRGSSRSVNQNALMRMWFRCVAKGTDMKPEDVYSHYCKAFLSRKILFAGEEESVVGETSTLSSAEMSEFLERIHTDVAITFGITLPWPDDQYYQDFVNEYK